MIHSSSSSVNGKCLVICSIVSLYVSPCSISRQISVPQKQRCGPILSTISRTYFAMLRFGKGCVE